MNFDALYLKYEKFLHYLLKRYYISYNYDEIFQMLLIRLWELQVHFDMSRSSDFHRYIRTKLHYYLLDLIRKEMRIPLTCDIDNLTTTVQSAHIPLQLSLITHQLSSKQAKWLNLHLSGFTQKEIHEMMHCSLSSVKNYKKQTYAILKAQLDYN
ncbi:MULTISPECIES: sigma-70 family RNA polymerase sigma factor [Staphylococcus]|nr:MULTISPECIES: sigma-70 family RNA polymerase sigma factor [Staphylococcus]ALN76718.1 sigma-70 family RNA polymerase sigma factor [Staphylococcus agnetis]MBY7665113.1 sigma-70 family RNA polymerase sigma factor [Staphylococcus agnetis]MCO4326456.1 sigma-70 family RNA polymerase sigma factor [Staphylococcus agnetis]MCO4337769.1 sigma-70 family RNA polymerase sigma factor [Staphylococcus agnetis]MCO4340822.1 sigma-70 family RNA polymerase sigma factor [Staphylococcus agnetis]